MCESVVSQRNMTTSGHNLGSKQESWSHNKGEKGTKEEESHKRATPREGNIDDMDRGKKRTAKERVEKKGVKMRG